MKLSRFKSCRNGKLWVDTKHRYIYKTFKDPIRKPGIKYTTELYHKIASSFPSEIKEYFQPLNTYQFFETKTFFGVQMDFVKTVGNETIDFNTSPNTQNARIANALGFLLGFLHFDIQTTACDIQFIHGIMNKQVRFYLIDIDLFEPITMDKIPTLAHHFVVCKRIYVPDNRFWDDFKNGYLTAAKDITIANEFLSMVEFAHQNLLAANCPNSSLYIFSTRDKLNTTKSYGEGLRFARHMLDDKKTEQVDEKCSLYRIRAIPLNETEQIANSLISYIKILSVLDTHREYGISLPLKLLFFCRGMAYCLESSIDQSRSVQPDQCEKSQLERLSSLLVHLHDHKIYPRYTRFIRRGNLFFLINWEQWEFESCEGGTAHKIEISGFCPRTGAVGIHDFLSNYNSEAKKLVRTRQFGQAAL